ncbi:MAG: TOBE domain-containing protein, partial [Campylobacter hyointestinalis]
MQLSARNQLLVEISEVKRGAVNSEIIAKLDEGENLRAIITEQSEE